MRKAKWYLIVPASIVLICVGWFLVRTNFYLFLIYHGKGDWASSRLANLSSVNRELFDEQLQDDRWFVRCSLLRTLRKMDDTKFALPILESQAEKEKDSTCLFEIAIALLKHGEAEKARRLLEKLSDDEKMGGAARDVLEKIPAAAPAS